MASQDLAMGAIITRGRSGTSARNRSAYSTIAPGFRMANRMIPSLECERLTLREYSPSDLHSFISILNNRNNLRYLPRKEPWPREIVEKWLQSLEAHWLSEGFGWWIVGHKPDGNAIGWCGLRRLEDSGEIEVLYLLAEEYWGRGLATEAARESIRYGFDYANLDEIIGLVLEGNIGSMRVLEKCGLIYQGQAIYFNLECLKYRIDRARFNEFYRAE